MEGEPVALTWTATVDAAESGPGQLSSEATRSHWLVKALEFAS